VPRLVLLRPCDCRQPVRRRRAGVQRLLGQFSCEHLLHWPLSHRPNHTMQAFISELKSGEGGYVRSTGNNTVSLHSDATVDPIYSACSGSTARMSTVRIRIARRPYGTGAVAVENVAGDQGDPLRYCAILAVYGLATSSVLECFLNLSFLPGRIPVGCLTSGTDPSNPGSAGKPRLTAPLTAV